MARWGRGPNRAFGHVHNWNIVFSQAEITELSPDMWGNNFGFTGKRYWECIRGGKVVHRAPSKDYPVPVGLFGQRSDDFHPTARYENVILRGSGIYDFGKV